MTGRRNQADLSLRPLTCDLTVLSNCDGSSRFCHGNTIVLCSVQGPIDYDTIGSSVGPVINCSVKYMSNTCSRLNVSEMESIISNSLGSVICSSLSRASQIQVNVLVLDDDGSLLSTALNAAYMALIDASIPCHTMLSSVTLAADQSGRVCIDPTHDQEQESTSTLALAFGQCEGDRRDIVTSYGDGIISQQAYFQLIQHARSAAQQILAFMSMTLKSRAIQTIS